MDIIPVIWSWRFNDMLLQSVGKSLKVFIGEAGADLAQRLVLFSLRIVAGEQEPAVGTSAFPAARVCTDDYYIDRVADTF